MARFNEINIQMLSKVLHQAIFKKETKVDNQVLRKIVKHLIEQKLWGRETEVLPDVKINLPKLYGDNIDEHFKIIGSKYAKPYKMMLKELISEKLPTQPKKWLFYPGWTRYTADISEPVPFPMEKCYVFDIEICVKEGNFPTLATAASKNAWYSWCSEKLVNEQFHWESDMSLSHLIPLETTKDATYKETSFEERLVIGHNVSFDRSFVKEQYLLQGSKLRFLDTMSLHMCVSGLTGIQRAMSMASKKNKTSNNELDNFGNTAFMWLDIGSLNNLPDVYNLYCKGEPIQKDIRDVFVTGTIDDVRRDFQNLVNYCARDVTATFEIVQKLMPMFNRRFPHPVTFAGMLEMSVPYLPINQNWNQYLKNSQATYDELEKEMKLSLGQVANDACSLLIDEKYKLDPWLWDLDWKTQDLKMNKIPPPLKRKKAAVETTENKVETQEKEEENVNLSRESEFDTLIKSAQHLRKVRPFLPGYPLWYRELCIKPNSAVKWEPGPALISTQIRSVPKLLRLMWDGYPLHYEKKEGWGYLVPKKTMKYDEIEEDNGFPLESLLKVLSARRNSPQVKLDQSKDDLEYLISQSASLMGDKKEESQLWTQILDKEFINDNPTPSNKSKPIPNMNIRGCDFYRLPHKDGPKNKVGNPLAKDFLSKITDGTLMAYSGNQATRALTISKMISYWKNAHKRITSQMTVWLKHNELPDHVIKNELYDDEQSYGALLPRMVTAGTVTRRAVEPTWLTASNAYVDRVGSELKGMVQAPPNYHFVGADVDSEELWIAAIIGDAYFAGVHGCTAFSWMTLQGKKSEGTDLHSRTAESVGITRDQAKVLNYGRIYGAGLPFAQRLLMQFNHRLLEEEAATKAKKMYSETKGVKKRMFIQAEIDEYTDAIVFSKEIMEPQRQWVGGSESHMFNKLEEIANSEKPTTPVLECRMSRSLEPATVNNNFMTSRINWVVQSSAVDFLHLMVVCMKWLMDTHNIKGRFAISIHDEVRYMVQSEDRYRAALALQITNLLTRSLFAYKLNMNDLPQSVAFFSSVDIDKCIRKEVTLDCKTPSNPHGLEKGYGIPKGESLDIHEVLEITKGTIAK